MSLPRIETAIGRFDAIGLEGLGNAALMSRFDTKFVLPVGALPELLDRCAETYSVLEIAGQRRGRYRTTYYDTPELTLYHAHHGGRAVRVKVRARSYLDTDTHFLELKRKSNKGRTTKTRVALPDASADPLAHLAELPGFATAQLRAGLRPAVASTFNRITLVRPNGAERVTIDTGIVFSIGDRTAGFPALAFAEVKQDVRGDSTFVAAMHALRVRDGAISKYCLGIASLHSTARTNNYKPLLTRLHRTERDQLAAIAV